MAADLAQAIERAAAGEFAKAEEICAALAEHERAAGYVLVASMWRQLGDPVRARKWDELGRDEAGDDVTRTDARIGLIADDIAQGDLQQAATLLQDLGDPIGDLRLRIRWTWVCAEDALARGDHAKALTVAQQAVQLSITYASPRHLLKSNLIAAVAGRDTALAIDCAHRAADHQWRYLAWAACRYLTAVDSPRWREWAGVLAQSIAGRLTADQRAVWRANPAVTERE